MNLTADEIRKFDAMLHPLVEAGINLLPGNVKPQAKMFDVWLYELMQTPGVLEKVLEIFPAKPA